MVTTRDRARRVLESRTKLLSPCLLDESLCLYSPQDNRDALDHPRVRSWLDFVSHHYRPMLPGAKHTVLLLLPCTKTKPYPLSLEHLRINGALLAAGFVPVGDETLGRDFIRHLPKGFGSEHLSLAPLRHDAGVVIHRAVISEPLAFVPYEHVLTYGGEASPASAYDDPGLFEKRGNAVSPWRDDFTGEAVSSTRWKWGEEESRAYVEMHNVMGRTLAQVVDRLSHHYDRTVAWVAPGLTHRSFILGAEERKHNGIAAFRRAGSERLRLTGTNDHLAEHLKVACWPTIAQCQTARERLATRLGGSQAQTRAIYARGGGGATPLALPELTQQLVSMLLAPAAPA